jgi:hypothetical protein
MIPKTPLATLLSSSAGASVESIYAQMSRMGADGDGLGGARELYSSSSAAALPAMPPLPVVVGARGATLPSDDEEEDDEEEEEEVEDEEEEEGDGNDAKMGDASIRKGAGGSSKVVARKAR